MGRKYQFGYDPTDVYFITCTTIRWIDIFTRDVYRQIIVDSLSYSQEKKGLDVYAWVIMTNHIHLIAGQHGEQPLGKIIGEFKAYTSKLIKWELQQTAVESRKDWMYYLFEKEGLHNPANKEFQLWQQDGSHPIVLDTRAKLVPRIRYTHYNPVKAGFVSEPEHWRWSSAVDYCGGQGLLKNLLVID